MRIEARRPDRDSDSTESSYRLTDHVRQTSAIEAKYDQLMAEMADPAVQADTAKFRAHSKALSEMQPLVERVPRVQGRRRADRRDRGAAQGPDMRELAQEELTTLEARRDALLAELKILLVPKDPNDEKNIVLEIRAGTGGDEAALFAADLFRMYSRYAERQGWRVEVLNLSDSGGGGIKEVIALIEGKQRLQPAEVRERRAPRAARAGDRSERPHPHVDGDRRGAARGRGSRHPDRREGSARRHVLLERPRRPERQHDLLGRPHHPHPDRHWSSRSRTRSRRSRTARRR